MHADLPHVIPLLKRDVSTTLGDSYDRLIEDAAADIRELDIADRGEKLVNDVQQYFHDTRVDPAWPACPRHAGHPLWYRAGSWWCVAGVRGAAAPRPRSSMLTRPWARLHIETRSPAGREPPAEPRRPLHHLILRSDT